MPAIQNVVYTEAQTEAMMDDTKLNPVVKEQRGEVHLSLTFDGVDIDPGAIFDALQALGVVQADKIPTAGRYEFVIS